MPFVSDNIYSILTSVIYFLFISMWWTWDINYWAVLVAGVVGMAVGALWYSPLLFGNVWARLSGFTKEKMEAAKKKGMAKEYILALIGSLVMACVLAHFVVGLNLSTFWDVAQLAFWAWLGFIATTLLSAVLWEGKKWSVWLINNAYYLVVLIIMGWILVSWK